MRTQISRIKQFVQGYPARKWQNWLEVLSAASEAFPLPKVWCWLLQRPHWAPSFSLQSSPRANWSKRHSSASSNSRFVLLYNRVSPVDMEFFWSTVSSFQVLAKHGFLSYHLGHLPQLLLADVPQCSVHLPFFPCTRTYGWRLSNSKAELELQMEV